MNICVFNKLNIRNVYLYLLISLIIIYVIAQYRGDKVSSFDIYSLNNSWSMENHEKGYTYVNLPHSIPSKPLQETTIIRKLPPDTSNLDGLYIYTIDQGLEVSINGKAIFSENMDYQRTRFLSTPGEKWNHVPIPNNSNNAILSITYKSYTMDDNIDLYQIYGARGSDFANMIVQNHNLTLSLEMSIFLIGIFSMGLYMYLRTRTDEAEFIRYFSEIVIISSIWLITENHIVKFSGGYFDILSLLRNISFMLFPLTLASYLFFIDEFRGNKSLMYVILILKFHILVRLILAFFNILPIDSLDELTSIILYITFISIAFIIFKNMYSNFSRKTLFVDISFILLFIFCIIDKYYLTLNRIGYSGFYAGIGFLIFFLLQTYALSVQFSKLFRRIQFADTYKTLAVTDSLTNLNNRLSFDLKLTEVNKIIEQNFDSFATKNFCILMIDLNNLKIINDTLGHSAGDDAIIRCSKIIKASFEGSGEDFGGAGIAYRIGGDEFSVVLFGVDEPNLQKKITSFYENIHQESKTLDYPLGAAIGYAYFDPKIDTSSNEVHDRADENMYKIKKGMKEKIL